MSYKIGLRTPEIIMIRRALAIYSRFYQDIGMKSEQQWEKDECKTMSKAGDDLSRRFRSGDPNCGLTPTDRVDQKVLDKIMFEIRAYGRDHAWMMNDRDIEAMAQAVVDKVKGGK